jgi:iron complex transport system substrate-binding protein
MRIASLVPSATEMLFALGLGENVVAVTHECDYPEAARALPHLTRTVVPEGLNAAGIDAEVKRVVGEGRALYELDEGRLAETAPDLIVTQAVCDVCAVSYDDVVAVAGRLPSRPRVLRQDPATLGEMLDDIGRLGEAAGAAPGAAELRSELEGRLATVEAAISGAPRPRVLALEWLDPPFVGGHWVPEMIESAGGKDVAGRPAEKSRQVTWEQLRPLGPDVVVAMPCGYYVEEALRQVREHREAVESLGANKVFVVDASSAVSRPGPRLVDGVELLGHLFHRDWLAAPGEVGFAELVPISVGRGI